MPDPASDNELEDRLVRIDDPGDPRVAQFRDIRERDLRGREGLFIAEGAVVLRVLAGLQDRSGRGGGSLGMLSVLILENRLAGMRESLQALPHEIDIMVASRAVMDAVAGFPIHRGVLALGERSAPASMGALLDGLPENALVLVAGAIANHDNMGGLFRNAAAFGVDAVLLDERSCDPLYRKAIRVSVGAALKVPFAQDGGLAEIMESLRGGGFDIWGLSPRGLRTIEAIPSGKRMALVVGSEGEGLPEEILAAIQTVRIRQSCDVDSLNVATASGIALNAVAGAMGRL